MMTVNQALAAFATLATSGHGESIVYGSDQDGNFFNWNDDPEPQSISNNSDAPVGAYDGAEIVVISLVPDTGTTSNNEQQQTASAGGSAQRA